MDKRKFLDTLICTYHHNINNSLTKILGAVKIIKKTKRIDKELELIAKSVHEIADFMSEMESEKEFKEKEYFNGKFILVKDNKG